MRNAAVLIAVVALASFAYSVRAQIEPSLSIQTHAGLSVTGEVGRVYQVQYAYGLEPTNTWFALQHFELKWNPHDFVDTTCPATEKRFYRAVEVEVPTNVVPVANMVFIPPGTFIMGSPTNEPARFEWEGPQTEVTISRGFWLGAYEVTQGEYLEVVGSNPSYFRNGTNGFGSGGPVTNESLHPVEHVTWFNATNYCALLTDRERTAGRLPSGWEYRLPTEAQWEYACRAGTRTAFSHEPALRSGRANFMGKYEYPPCGGDLDYCYNANGVYLGRTVEVGSFPPNTWGLYDMHGNVSEWCQDWWADSLPGGIVTDPVGPSMGWGHVFRDGLWGSPAYECRSSFRSGDSPQFVVHLQGFRVALVSLP